MSHKWFFTDGSGTRIPVSTGYMYVNQGKYKDGNLSCSVSLKLHDTVKTKMSEPIKLGKRPVKAARKMEKQKSLNKTVTVAAVGGGVGLIAIATIVTMILKKSKLRYEPCLLTRADDR